MTKMRAVQLARYGAPSTLVVSEIDVPEPKPGEIRVRVHAASVNPIDAKVLTGYFRVLIPKKLPFTPGMDLSGVVDSVGEGVTKFRTGDAVFASPSHKRMGALAEFCCVNAKEVAKKPESVDHLGAASLPLVALTAWDSLFRHARLKAGQRILIQAGAGGVGTAAIQIAKSTGATVLTTCSARNVELVRSLGADTVIDYNQESYAVVAKDCDAILEAVGPSEFSRGIKTLRRGGSLVAISSGLPELAAKYGPLFGPLFLGFALGGRIISARLTRNVRFIAMNRNPDGETLGKISALVDAGKLKPVIDSVFPLEQTAQAYEKLETGRCRGKVVVDIAGK